MGCCYSQSLDNSNFSIKTQYGSIEIKDDDSQEGVIKPKVTFNLPEKDNNQC